MPALNAEDLFKIHDISKNIIEAFDNTGKKFLKMAWNDEVSTSAECRSSFVLEFQKESSEGFEVLLDKVTVNQNTCNNGANSANYGMNILGEKASSGECVYYEYKL